MKWGTLMSDRMRSAHRRHYRFSERGAVAVEFALVLPVLTMLLIGTITTGLSYSHALGVTNAVREGARFGAIADGTDGAWATDVMRRVHATQFDDRPDLAYDDPGVETTICVQLIKLGTPPPSPDCNGAGPGVDSTDLAKYPLPPTSASLPAGVCVVRVVAAREYTISAPPFFDVADRKMVRGSVARYETSETC
jgi:Flp pilus assembly pilin Flp